MLALLPQNDVGDGVGDGEGGVKNDGVGDDGGRAFVLEATKEWEHREQKACHVCCTVHTARDQPNHHFPLKIIPRHLNEILIEMDMT